MMDISEAIGIAEGFIECDDERLLNEAWQLLIDTGVCWDLQGWFGRNAIRLIESGVCKPPPESLVQAEKIIPEEKAEDGICDACECTPCDCSWGHY